MVINLGVDCIAPLVIGLLTQSTYFYRDPAFLQSTEDTPG